MKRFLSILLIIPALIFLTNTPALAQAEQPTSEPEPKEELVLFTQYPIQEVGIGETVSIRMTLRTETQRQTVRLEMKELPEGWEATFRGGDRVIRAVHLEPNRDTSVTLQLKQPEGVSAGSYPFVVLAEGEKKKVELPLELIVGEKVPSSISFQVDLPTLIGTPSTTFRYNVTLKNDGDEDLSVNLFAEAPQGFLVTFKTSGQEVTSIPLSANGSKRLSVEAKPVVQLAAGRYPLRITAQGETVAAELTLTAEVTGQSDLSITGADGRLSGQAIAGRETPLKITLVNNGSAPARGIELSSSEPSGWNVTFEPDTIPEIPAGEQAEVTMKVRPADKAVAGDYMLTVRAKPAEGSNQSADFRITVRTSTLWGVVGLGLIAIAVGVVALAVFRFGRR